MQQAMPLMLFFVQYSFYFVHRLSTTLARTPKRLAFLQEAVEVGKADWVVLPFLLQDLNLLILLDALDEPFETDTASGTRVKVVGVTTPKEAETAVREGMVIPVDP